MALSDLSQSAQQQIQTTASNSYHPLSYDTSGIYGSGGGDSFIAAGADPIGEILRSRFAQNNTMHDNAIKTATQGYAQSNGDKNLFLKSGGHVDPNDPWGFYRESAGNNLAQFAGGTDPSNIFKDKLTQMSTGQFSPDDPSYQWRFNQGQQTVERSLGARGLLNSGNAAIELQQYGQGAASQEYGAQFGRMLQGLSGVESQYNTQFSRLASMAGITLDPSTSGKINAGIQQAQIGANASVQSASIGQSTGLANNRLAQVENQQQQNLYAQYNQGLGDTLTGRNWQNGGQ